MSISHLLTPPARRQPQLIAAIDHILELMLNQIQQEGSFRFNDKLSYIYIQIILSLFPEVALHFKDGSLEKAYASSTNPFARHYRKLNKLAITASWLVTANKRKLKSVFLNYTEHPNFFIVSSQGSIWNTSRRFEFQMLEVLLKVAGQRKIEHSKDLACYEIDFLVDGDKAIEVNSTSHFLYKTNIFGVAEQVKKTHLELLGISQVVDINSFEVKVFQEENQTLLEDYVRSVLDSLH